MPPKLKTADADDAQEIRDKTTRIDTRRLWWQVLVTAAYTAGLRLNEIVNLLWTDVDFEEDRIRVIAKPEIGDLHGWQPKGHRRPDGANPNNHDRPAHAATGAG